MEEIFQLVNGVQVPRKDICLILAESTFSERRGMDDNPKIVQMKTFGELIDHWYYRSDDWINQTFSCSELGMFAYVGNPRGANPLHFGPGSYVVDEDLTKMALSDLRR